MLSILLEGKPEVCRKHSDCRWLACACAVLVFGLVAVNSAHAQCSLDSQCDDGNPCTEDQCICGIGGCPGECWNVSTCEDGLLCNGTSLCCTNPSGCGGTAFGACQPGTPLQCPPGEHCSEAEFGCVECENNSECDDGNQCTIDTCDLVMNECVHTNANQGTGCSDGSNCTQGDVCDGFGSCLGVDTCADLSTACQTGVCMGTNCQLVNRTNGSTCSDADPCTATGECQNGVCIGGPANGCVDLELRLPPGQGAYHVGDVVEVQLWAVANGCPAPPVGSDCISGEQAIQSITAVMSYDETIIALADPADIGSPNPEDPCNDVDPCNFDCGMPGLYYNWGSSLFPNTCDEGDDVNFPCSGIPDPDGDFAYTNLQQITCNGNPAPDVCVPPSGMFVTTFKFEAIAPNAGLTDPSPVNIDVCATNLRTQVAAGGGVSGLDVLGDRIPTSVITVECTDGSQCPFGVCTNGACSSCPPPVVEAEGPRYAAVTPAIGPPSVAIRVEGVDPSVAGVVGYLDGGGVLRSFVTPMAPGPGGWGTVHAHGSGQLCYEMPAGKLYNFYADCDPANPGTSLSEAVPVRLWKGGDADNSGLVDIGDAVRGVDGFRGRFHIEVDTCTTDEDCDCLGPGLNRCRGPHYWCDPGPGLCLWITIENVDNLSDIGCGPNGNISIRDIVETLNFFQGFPDACNPGCP